ncbi:MAG: acetyltransferase [Victivallaceae bacterium]|nr:acetyltransferase [Victivallaceae bacterium]
MQQEEKTTISANAEPIVIYGTCNWARVLLDELSTDSRYHVAGITCDAEYYHEEHFCGYPLYPFHAIETIFPPEKFRMLVCGIYASPRERNAYYQRAKQKNYICANFISRNANVSPSVIFGENNFIFGGAYIDAMCRFGNNNIVRPNSYIGHESVVGNTVFIAPGCNIAGKCTIGDLSMIGIGATLIGKLVIGREVLIGAGALMLEDAPPLSKYLGVPAKRSGEIDPDCGILMEGK